MPEEPCKTIQESIDKNPWIEEIIEQSDVHALVQAQNKRFLFFKLPEKCRMVGFPFHNNPKMDKIMYDAAKKNAASEGCEIC